MKSIKTFLILAVVIMLALTACGPAATESAAEAEETTAPTAEEEVMESHTLIVVMNIDDLITLDPAWAGETTNQFIHANTYETLIEFSPDDYGTPMPKLAESWEVSDDAMVYTFHLKEGLLFASGNPITAEDVVFSWMRGKKHAELVL